MVPIPKVWLQSKTGGCTFVVSINQHQLTVICVCVRACVCVCAHVCVRVCVQSVLRRLAVCYPVEWTSGSMSTVPSGQPKPMRSRRESCAASTRPSVGE